MWDEIFKYSIDRMLASGMSVKDIFSAELAIPGQVLELEVASLGLQLGAIAAGGIPLAVWVGGFVAMGAPYEEAREMVKSENFQTGFSYGFVTKLLKWEWRHTVSRFFKFSPGKMNGFDESLSYEGANAYNAGLKTGFTTALYLYEDGRKTLLTRIQKLSRGSKPGVWNRLNQISYVIELATAARRNHIISAP